MAALNVGKLRESVLRRSPVTQGLCAFVLLVNILGQFPICYDYLALEPGATLPSQSKLWMLITGGYVEWSFLLALVDIVVLLYASNLFEELWTTIEFAKFVLITNFIACVCTSATFIFLYMVTFNLSFLFHHFSGMTALYAAFLVAFKQSYPQVTLRAAGLALEARLLPLIFVSVLVVLYAIGLLRGANVLLAGYGVFSSWTFLRFFSVRDGAVGDVTEAMAFPDFFPAALQPIIALIGARIYKLLVLVHICPLGGPATSPVKLPVVTDADTERRKQLALRDLTTRLAATPSTPAQIAPLAEVIAAPDKAAGTS
eukprot:m.136348 g.136348  ORF g.136348 m.136348 type:complete len:314 (+) comp14886_c1_seq3:47-988(+)